MNLKPTLAWKLALVFVIFATALVVGVGTFSYTSGRDALKNTTLDDLLAVALEKQAALDDWIEEQRMDIAALAKSPVLAQQVGLLVEEPDSDVAQTAHSRLVSEMEVWTAKGQSYFELMLLHPQTGQVIASTDATAEGKYRENRPYFIQGKDKPYVQNVYYSMALTAPAMSASAPIRSADGRLLGVLAGRLNLEELNTIMQRRTGLKQTDDAYLVNASNLFVTQPRLLSDPAVLQRGVHTEPVERCLQRESGTMSSTDYRGIPVLSVFRWLPAHELCLITEVDQAEALAPIHSFRTTIVIIGGLALLGATLLAAGLARTITRPIRKLVRGTQEIRRGNLDYRLDIAGNDELGQLAAAFNDMTAHLHQSMTELRQHRDHLEEMVQEQTQALRESEERYRTLAETSPDMIFVIDQADRVQYVNSFAAKQFAVAPEDIVGQPRAALFPAETAAHQREALQQVFNTGEPLAVENTVQFPDRKAWLSTWLVPMQDEYGNVTSVMGVSRDVTDRKQSEEALRASEKRFRRAVREAPFPIMIHAEDGEVLLISDAWTELTGYAHSEIPTISDWTQKAYGRRQPLTKADIDRLYGIDEKEHEGEYTITTRDGETLIWDFSSAPLGTLPDGRHLVITMAMDVTERKRAEDALAEKAKELARSNAELEQFAYVASHDLQEPLRMITSYLQLLDRRYKEDLDANAHDFIDFAVDGAQRMQRLIDDLLVYSRVGTKGKDLAPTDSEEVLDRVLKDLEIAIEENDASVSHDALPTVMADDVQLGQLFQNLISNAIKFHGDEPPEVHIGVERQGEKWQFTVRDNGIGIDPKFAERVFVIFQRLHTRQEYGGTGIGLAVSKRIVERHGGEIWAESQPDEGSTFYFTLPAAGGQ